MAWGMRWQSNALSSHGTVTSGDREKCAEAAVKLRSLKEEEKRWVEDLKGEAMDSLGG